MTHTSSQFRDTQAPPFPIPPYNLSQEEPQARIIIVLGAGTSGNDSIERYRSGIGFQLFQLIYSQPQQQSVSDSEFYSSLVRHITAAFGRNMTRLPAVFGVSRQTIYNWRKGEIPKDVHRVKLVELADAASVFSEANFKPTAAMLNRTVAHGKSLLSLIAEGAGGSETAKSLMKIVERGQNVRARLDKALGEQPKVRLDVSDIGAPAFDENSK